MEFYTNALSHVLTFGPLTAMLGATLLGVFIGALPGLNPVMAIALLLPLTYSMNPLVTLAMVAGIYNGSMYGGAIPAILLRIPGTPASIATTFDGFPMADRGEAAKALKIACWSSAIGGIASAIALMTMGPMLARVTLFFGPAEYFWIAIFGMASVAVMVGSDPVKGMMAAVLGLLIGTMGIDNLSGQARFTFGQTWLLGGVDLIVVLVGLYALPPVLQLAEKCDLKGLSAAELKLADVPFDKGEIRGLIPTWLRASGIGIGVGILPGAGGNIAAFLSYNAAKNASDDPSSFGKGNPHGGAGTERAYHPRPATGPATVPPEPAPRGRLHDGNADYFGPDLCPWRCCGNPRLCAVPASAGCPFGSGNPDPDVRRRLCHQWSACRFVGDAGRWFCWILS